VLCVRFVLIHSRCVELTSVAGITVTSNGVAVAELVPLRRGRFVDAQVALEAFSDAPRIDLQSLRDDLDLIGDPDFLPRG